MPAYIDYPLIIVACIMGFFFLFIVGSAMLEKRPVQPYYVPAVGEEYDPSTAAKEANKEANQLGFLHAGLCHDGKGKAYKIRYDFWITPDHSILADIGSGTVTVIPCFGIWLLSRTTDGRILCTTNEIGEQDISGVEEQQTWSKFDFSDLVEKHQRRLEGLAVEPFPTDSPMSGFFEIRKRKADALVQRGYASYLNDEHKVWRYTLKGALVFYLTAMWIRPLRRGLRSIGLVRE